MVSRVIRDLSADLISLKLGINIMGAVGTLSERTLKPAIIGFIKTIREGHPRVPIAVVSPIFCQPRETTPNALGLTLCSIREEICDVVCRLQKAGDGSIFYESGLGLFGEDMTKKYQPDSIHPNGDGYEMMAENYDRNVMTKLIAKLRQRPTG
jgi:lysophospholipase L1-like esterase